MNKIELLLPAGNWDCLRAAVENGADAVYLGVTQFNARRRADNFSLKEMKKVTDYCHQQGVKVYITMNILVKNSEINNFFATTKELYLANIDAIIIQEISFLPILKQNFPDLKIHLSTQAGINNSYFYDLIKQADRVILPRELSKEEIKSFIEKTKLPVEVFVQGALCFSYSGKCLFSSFLGGRSGNRGLCVQPCRRKYNEAYLLSMKDLCLLEKIPDLINLGTTSLKIEGRLRNPKYIKAAAKAYRQAIDSHYEGNFNPSPILFKELELAFNREFTKCYFNSETELVSPEKPTSRGLFLGTMENNNLILLKEDLAVGDGLGIWFKDKVDGAVLRRMEKAGRIINQAKAGEKVKLFIRAPPETKIYKTSSLKEPEKISFEKKKPIIIKPRIAKEIVLPKIKTGENTKPELLVKVYSAIEGEQALNAKADKVFYNIFAPNFNPKFSAYIPRILTDQEVEKALGLTSKHKVKNLLIGDLGVYAKLKDKGLNLYLDYSNNLFNDLDLEFFKNTTPIISPELNFKELNEFKNKNFAVFIHGPIILMNTKYSALPSQLKDEKCYIFPVRKEHTYTQILNSRKLGLFEEVLSLKEVSINKIFLDLENKAGEAVKLYKRILAGERIRIDKKGFTFGHWKEGVI